MRLGFVLAAILLATPAFAQELDWTVRGYSARACGFDMNHNGIPGEAADCNVCDGVTTDPDGDGNAERIVYVNCDVAGNDDTACGAVGDQCSTINYAANTRGPAMAGSEEVIVCFKGTCSAEPETVSLPSGKGGTFSKPAQGNQVRDFLYPTHPAMIVGQDADNDGNYPPFDTDDTAHIDGTGKDRAFQTPTSVTRNFEMAHFSVSGYGNTTASITSIGFVGLHNGCENCYFHDLELQDINKDKSKCTNVQIFNSLSGNDPMNYVAVENIECDQCGGYFMRGGMGKDPTDEHGPIRHTHNTYTVHACDVGVNCGACVASTDSRGAAVWAKVWGTVTGIELLNNKMDQNLGAWSAPSRSNSSFLVANTCSRDWDVIGNEIIDVRKTFLLSPLNASGNCDGGDPNAMRPIDSVNVDKNIVKFTTAAESAYTGANIFLVDSDSEDGTTDWEMVTDFNFTNNMIVGESGVTLDRGILALTGGAGPCSGGHGGTTIIDSNTIHIGSADASFGSIQLQPANGTASSCNPQTAQITNNIISGLTGTSDIAIRLNYTPSTLTVDYNTKDPTADHIDNGTRYETVTAWAAGTPYGTNSPADCDPTYVDIANLDGHLSGLDTCALGNGSTTQTKDVDGDLRGTPDDIGADDQGGGTAGCGDGTVDVGEQCDDSNTANGDCCSSTCQFEAAASPCTTDNNECTTDTCDGAGTCDHTAVANGTSCDDGFFCNGADTCTSGVCSTHAGDPCTSPDVCNESTNACDSPGDCTWTTALEYTAGPDNGNGVPRNYRSTIEANATSISGNSIRVTILAETIVSTNPDVDGSSIGVMSSGGNFDVAPTRVTWDTGSSTVVVPAGTEKVSDEITFTWDPTKRHGFHLFMTGGSREFAEMTDGNTRYNQSTGTDQTMQTTAPTGVTTNTWGLKKLEVCVPNPVGGCGNGVVEAGEDCDDGNTTAGDCCSATCQYEASGTACTTDGNECTADTCDGAGTCDHDPQPVGMACTDDGNECTDDQCDGAGACAHPSKANGTVCLSDGNVCTDDTCQSGVCTNTNNTASCDDGLFCTATDVCASGSCTGSGDPCPGADGDIDCTESCDETANNCTLADPNGSACDDGLFCTADDTCLTGACVTTGDPCPGADGDGDCSEMCDEASDSCTGNDDAGTACVTDGDICTDDVCDGAGICSHDFDSSNDPSCTTSFNVGQCWGCTCQGCSFE